VFHPLNQAKEYLANTLLETTVAQELKKNLIGNKEISAAGSSYWDDWNLRPYNPAELYQKKGNYDLYDDIREDDQVKAVLSLKKILILNSDWLIECEDEDVKEFITACLTNFYNGLFAKSMYEILSGMDYGWSITEKIFDYADTPFGKKIILKNLKTRAPHTFDLKHDDSGNLTNIIQHKDGGDGDLDPAKFIIYSHNSEFSNSYGTSDINKGVYRAWWSKTAIIKFWNIYLEKYCSPIPTVKIPTSASAADREKVKMMLKNIQSRTAFTIPADFEMELLNIAGSQGSEYERAINKYDTMIARAVLVPDLIGLSGSETSGGSYALGDKQFDIFYTILQFSRQIIEKIIDKEIIKPLVFWNYGSKYEAHFKFNQIDEEKKKSDLNLFIDGIKSGKIPVMPEQINWFLEQVNAPLINDDILSGGFGANGQLLSQSGGMETPVDVEAEAKAKLKGTVGGVQGILGIQESVTNGTTQYDAALNILMEIYGFDMATAKKILGDKSKLEKALKDKSEIAKQISRNKNDEDEDKNGGIKKFSKLNRATTKYEKKVDFAKIDNDFMTIIKKYLPEFSKAYKRSINATIDEIRRRRILENKRLDLVNKLSLKYRQPIDKLWRDLMRESMTIGGESVKRFNITQTFGLDDEDIVSWINTNGAYISGVEETEIMKKIKGVLIGGIRSGAGIRDMISQLESALNPWEESVITTDKNGDTIETQTRLETIIRTTVNKAYNEERAQEFKEMGDEIVAYQFSAIMDDRTSDICEALDGKVFPVSELDYYDPPLHYNCRSLIIPIYKDEEFTGYDEMPATEESQGDFLVLK
jgi:SPP1 gp7 family putative phage head morphogenesis protein